MCVQPDEARETIGKLISCLFLCVKTSSGGWGGRWATRADDWTVSRTEERFLYITCLHTYLLILTYLLAYLHTYIHTYLLTNLLTYLHTYLLTYLHTDLHNILLTYILVLSGHYILTDLFGACLYSFSLPASIAGRSMWINEDPVWGEVNIFIGAPKKKPAWSFSQLPHLISSPHTNFLHRRRGRGACAKQFPRPFNCLHENRWGDWPYRNSGPHNVDNKEASVRPSLLQFSERTSALYSLCYILTQTWRANRPAH